MKIFSTACLAAIVTVVFAEAAGADYLEVRRRASVKAEPDRHSETIERVERATYLELLDEGEQQDGYYHVQVPDTGEDGWIYRTFVRRYYGQMPGPTTEERILESLQDPSLQLTTEQRRWAVRHLRIGKPQVVYERVRQGYVLAQDGCLKIPRWVQYELSREDLAGIAVRQDDFRPDGSIPFRYRAELEDYSSSGYDRGHMAPAADMKRSERVMSESFLLSNMAPQIGQGFNRNIWQDLEAAVRGWVGQRERLTIITGPVFAVENDRVGYDVIGGNRVAVPTHFYKIVVDAGDPEQVQALAFLMPNEDLSGHDYSEYLTAIDEVERLTGLDFLSALPLGTQNEVESQRPTGVW
ncbi:MAG: DNA/RNA non-specific endonuclease [Planctomycetota bacterium]|jgi:endonuclease G